MEFASTTQTLQHADVVDEARQIMRDEAFAVLAAADRLDEALGEVVEILLGCAGKVVVTGVGKAGLIGRKLAATLASTGTRSCFLHPTEAVHGDLGCVTRGDVVLALSYSGESEEVIRLLPYFEQLQIPIIALTGHARSTLAQRAAGFVVTGPVREAGSLYLAPTTSTAVMLAVGDALALVVSRLRGFGADDFARHHPGGSLGRKLSRVDEVMRPLCECRVALESRTIRDVFVQAGRPGRRSGAILLTGDAGRLMGIFTDSDLARLLERRQDLAIDRPISEVMTRNPTTILSGSWMTEAIQQIGQRKISELPVVDAQGCPVGMIDITDIVGLLPLAAENSPESAEPQDGENLPILPFSKSI